MSKIRLEVETSIPPAPGAGHARMYFRDGFLCYQLEDGNEHQITDPMAALDIHIQNSDAHPGYLTEEEANLVYAAINHVHATGNVIHVSKTPGPGEFSKVADAIAAAVSLAPSSTNRFLIEIGPGVYLEDPGLTIPAYVYPVSKDPWAASVIKTTDPTVDFITIAGNSGIFNVGISGPTTPGKSAVKQIASGTTKLYWINIKEGYYGVTLDPVSGTARCHCIGVVTDGPTQMNRMFNCDNPAGVGVFILMQSGPMTGTWVGPQPSAVYTNGNGSLTPPKANATVDLCQFRGSGYDALYADNGGLIRGISCSFAGGVNAIHVGPNGSSKVDVHASQIKPGGWTKDIFVESPTAIVSYSGTATESKIDVAEGAKFTASFADVSDEIDGHVIFGELWIGNKNVKTPLASYIQADKNTGLVYGGGLSRGIGVREVIVDAGEAFIDTVNGLKHISWPETSITIPAFTPKAQIYADNNGVIQFSTINIDKTTTCLFGEVATNADSVVYLLNQSVLLPQFRARLCDYMEKVLGPINVSGGLITPQGLGFDVSASTYFLTEVPNETNELLGATFTYWKRNGSGGWITTTGHTTLNVSEFDDGDGIPNTMTDGYWRRDVVYVTKNSGSTDVHVVMGQAEYSSQIDASVNPIAPDVLSEQACRLAALVVQKGATSFTVIDQRPRLGQMAAASAGVTNHNDLSNRDNPAAHPQYELVAKRGIANGYAPLDETGAIPIGFIPPIPHGNLGGGALHSDVTESASGFMSAADKVKLNSINENNVPSSNEKAALAGTSGTPVSANNKLVDSADSRLANDRRAIPQGAVNAVQYNKSGTSAGAANVLIDTADDRLLLKSAAHNENIPAPASGVKIFGRKRAGRSLSVIKDASGLETPLQTAFFTNKSGILLPIGNGLTVTNIGFANGTVTGTATTRTVTTSDLLSSLRRIGYVSNNAPGSVTGWREGVAQLFLGNQAKMGGFFIAARFGLVDLPVAGRWFFGLDNATAAPSNVNPMSLNNVIGFGADSADGNVMAWSRGVSVITPQDTGIPCKSGNAVFEIRLFATPNSQKIGMSLERLDTDQYWEIEDICALTEIPGPNVLMGLKFWATNNTNNGPVAIDLISLYKETAM